MVFYQGQPHGHSIPMASVNWEQRNQTSSISLSIPLAVPTLARRSINPWISPIKIFGSPKIFQNLGSFTTIKHYKTPCHAFWFGIWNSSKGSQWLYTKNFWTCCDFGQVPFSCLFLSFDKGKKGKSSRGTSTNGGNSFKFRAHKAITHGTMDIWDLDLHRKVRDQVVVHGYFLDTQKKTSENTMV